MNLSQQFFSRSWFSKQYSFEVLQTAHAKFGISGPGSQSPAAYRMTTCHASRMTMSRVKREPFYCLSCNEHPDLPL